MRDKLILNNGDHLEEVSMRTKGHMGQTEITTYNILNINGNKVGRVEYTDHMQVRGFRRTQTVQQFDLDGRKILEESW